MAKKDEALQKRLEQRIAEAKKARDEWAKQFKVDMGRAYFEGQQNPGYPEEEWITINKIYSHLQAQLPMLYSMDPYFYVKLKKSFSPDPEQIAQFEQQGRTRAAMLNYLKGELNLKEKARLSIQSAHFEFGVIKVRYAADEEKHPQAGEPIVDEEGNEVTGENGEVMRYPETVPVNERYVIDYVDPDDMLWDADARTLEDSWSWVAQKIRTTRGEAQKDKRLSRSAVDSIPSMAPEGEEKKRGVFARWKKELKNWEKPEDEPISYWEIYDLKKKQRLIIAEGADAPLMDPAGCPKGVEDHPFVFLRFVLREKSPYPIPPIFPGLDPQKEYCLSRSRVLTHRKRFNRKYEVFVQGLEDEAELSKLESGDDGTIIRKMTQGRVVEAIEDAPLDQQTYTELALLNNDMVEMLGSPDNARGIAAADSATEASLLDKRLEVQEGDRMSMVVDFVTGVARKLDQLVQAHIDEDQAVKVTGPNGEAWHTIRKDHYEEIAGEYEYSVNVGASSPRLPDIERAQWIAFLSQVVIPFPHILTAPSVMRRMAEMFHIEDEAALEEFRQLGLKMLSGQMPMPGANGSQAGVSEQNPVAAILGSALGQGGGNVNGGGSETSASV